jgi:hypothetical protein
MAYRTHHVTITLDVFSNPVAARVEGKVLKVHKKEFVEWVSNNYPFEIFFSGDSPFMDSIFGSDDTDPKIHSHSGKSAKQQVINTAEVKRYTYGIRVYYIDNNGQERSVIADPEIIVDPGNAGSE